MGVRCRVLGSGYGKQDARLWVLCSGSEFQGAGFGVQGSEFRIQGSGFSVQGSGFRVVVCLSLFRRLRFRNLGFWNLGFEVWGVGFLLQERCPPRKKSRVETSHSNSGTSAIWGFGI